MGVLKSLMNHVKTKIFYAEPTITLLTRRIKFSNNFALFSEG
jgi:uncharacterized membrane protein YecN with MAPEG domain